MFFLFKFMSDIIMNFDISAGLTPQRSTIICHDMNHITKKKIQNYGGTRPNPMTRNDDKYFLNKINKMKHNQLTPIMKKV